LSGGDGDDKLTGGADNDALDGGAGNDTYYFDADTLQGVDTLTEGFGGGIDSLDFAQTTTVGIGLNLSSTGAQAVHSGTLTLTLSAGDVIENVNGGNLADTITGNVLDNTLMGQDGNDTLNGGAGNDTLRGGPGDDMLIGDDGNDYFDAGSGNDTLNGGAGNDLLYGGSGNDVYVFDTDTPLGTDTADDASGVDWLDFSQTDSFSITVNLNTITAQAVNANLALTALRVENVVGGSLDDTLAGNSDNNVLVGGGGADTLTGGSGRDLLIGCSGADILRGGTGDDLLLGGLTSYFNEGTRVLNRTALDALMSEWGRTDADYATRVNHLQAGGGLNDPYLLNGSTVSNDAGAIDQLFGEGDTDWFLVSAGDYNDALEGEMVTTIP
jgi:Ca2+-binding RTX toxin-like protein